MTLFVFVGLAICFSVGLVLSSTLTYLNIRNLLRVASYVSEYDYRWEKIAEIIISNVSIGLAITGIVAIATATHSTEEIYSWLDAIIMSHPNATDLHLSSLGYMGGTPSGSLDCTGHCFRGYRQNGIFCLRVGTACSFRCCITFIFGTLTQATGNPQEFRI
ncbi:hypothetical protein Alg130_10609 [Pyrenophora tritici-repentis]|nr:hypothetical protein Alg130_10609 [Pyrenophora tritici-repentis]